MIIRVDKADLVPTLPSFVRCVCLKSLAVEDGEQKMKSNKKAKVDPYLLSMYPCYECV